MLSILIPVYNYDITKLVNDLHQQATEAGIAFEIIVMEDGSQLFLDSNKSIEQLPYCQYIVLEKNIGRSAVRNRLADSAKHQFLLFADCDAGVQKVNFIANYTKVCHADAVVIGGTAYDTACQDPQFSLRLKYGRARESNTDYLLKQASAGNFVTFNFLIDKDVFHQVRFDETIDGYGHEDTVFGHALSTQGFKYDRIDNPLVHLGLDDNANFLRKTVEGVENLYKLYDSTQYPFLLEESKLLRNFLLLKRFKLIKLANWKFKLAEKILYKNLVSAKPKLFYFDLYKLFWMCRYHLNADKLSAN